MKKAWKHGSLAIVLTLVERSAKKEKPQEGLARRWEEAKRTEWV